MTNTPVKIVIVGGVAGGASAATRARRMNENAEIILIEKDEYVSFANCGLPYYLGGEIQKRGALLVATAEFLAQRYRLDVRTRQEVVSIDRAKKTVTVRCHVREENYVESYDKLILSPGASPIMPPLEGVDASNVFTLRNLNDTDQIQAAMERAAVKNAVVVGAGYIGLEMVEQLRQSGFEVALVELQPQILPLLDAEMAQPLLDVLNDHGVAVHTGCGLKRIIANEGAEAIAVELENGTRIDTSLVILGIGVRPNNQLAQDSGLEIGEGGGIRTNACMQTNDSDIYAVGDVAEYVYGPTDSPMRVALAGPANRAGRLAGEHAATGKCRPMAQVFGTSIVRVFGKAAGMTGMTLTQARRCDQPARSVTIVAKNHAGYYPGATPITLKLVFDATDGRVLGAQAIGEEGVDKRIDVIATAMAMNATVWDLAGLDLAYAPPFGAAKDPVHMAAFAACNQLDGVVDFCDSGTPLDGQQVLDVRSEAEIKTLPLQGVDKPINIPVDQLRKRLGELDNSKTTAVSCLSGMRAYIAARILKQSGFPDVHVVAGGAMLRNRSVQSKG
jgi:NADPH-dependent 2,4-dienoyl-CoA reductase/sulfur reductase-like enzyme/rhodanese-related sulfurtransferase